ncbi:lycopene beta-cyclase CrtY [Novosphingobium bradum]|uniref:Lycopene beta-cyclase CrtY n=1 Tax=Novosphingobium bradum TaxID=1737444 RepID=A0ABV7IRL0_9SPHN
MEAGHTDIAILGGGLAGGLIALALAERRPGLRLAVIEREARLGGNHLWSFFASDLADGGAALVEPLIAARWDAGYDVRFPAFSRTLATPYCSITSAKLDAVLRERLPGGAIVQGEVAAVEPGRVTLADGRTLRAGAVIDARGAARLPHLVGGWQKFVGQMVRTAAPHGLVRPVVMDASVAQADGYRFVYALPFSADTVFIEDTYYSDGPQLDPGALRGRIGEWAAAQGWQVAEVLSEETGVLPVVAGGDFAAWRATMEAGSHGGVALAGVRAGLFQPLTSYSLPDAVRFALMVAGLPDLSGTGLAAASRAWAERHWRAGAFYRILAAMLLGAAPPGARWRVMQRFYRLSPGLIERFYAGGSTMMDKARILAGKPPVPLGAALKVIAGRVPLGSLGGGA